ncbi:hypothetical protein O181_080922 [Austropuccinia psidii MF-1]|uniref:Chromo domain-containing protein n=1 Tax=Austropuccinia psidii MF-1 TaxID=1389203 RepID=A0A9Q3FMJ3_9BASI|nr:hypothetical protein [Austropuccinia psidii MF-1]
MVFFKSEEEHVTHVSTVLARLRANNLFAKASKCLFHVFSVEYLGYVDSSKGLNMEQAKVQQILSWPPPRSLKALQSFLGFSNFYCRLIKNYSKKISSLTSFLKKDSCVPLNEEALRQFNQLTEEFTIAPILSSFYPSLPTIVVTDASAYALGAVLSEISDKGKHPIAFDSHKILPLELNYEIHYKELLGIVWALKCWRAFLLSLSSSFEVLTNHSSLRDFMSPKILTFRQACWAKFLSEFHFSITYFPGCLATLPDALSPRENAYRVRGEDFIRKNPMNYQKIIKQDEIQASKFFAVKMEAFSNLIKSIEKALWQDSQYRSIIQDLGKGKSVQDYSLDSSSQLLLFKDQVVVPNDPTIQLRILQTRHDSPLAGHPGQEKTLKLVKRDFHWSGMTQFIKDYSIHPVFHISLLEPVKTSKIPSRHQEPPPPIIIEEEEEWEASQILDLKLKRGKLWYLVEWKGLSKDSEISTWEPTENLKNCPEHVKDFHSLYPDKPGPNSSRD